MTATEDPPQSAEVLIEFTTPEATVEHLSYDRPHVIGTTGLSHEQLASVEEASHSVPIVLAPNMSVGVNLLREVAREISAKLGEGYDIEVVEAHHRNKKDAPSGTALFLARAAAEGRKRNLEEVAVYGREGLAPRQEGEIGIHALRGGAVVGEHRLTFYSGGRRSRSSTAPSPAALSPTALSGPRGSRRTRSQACTLWPTCSKTSERKV